MLASIASRGATETLAALAAWIDARSTGLLVPWARNMSIGRFASIVPCNFAAPPPLANASADALLLFVAARQAEGVALPLPAIGAAFGQAPACKRLEQLLAGMDDGVPAGCAIVGLVQPAEPPAGAVERAGLGVDLRALAVLAVPLWPLPVWERTRIAKRLPLIPS